MLFLFIIAGVFAVVSLMVGQVRYELIPDTSHQQNTENNNNNNDAAVFYRNITTTDGIFYSTSTTVAPLGGLTPIEAVTALTMLVGILQVT